MDRYDKTLEKKLNKIILRKSNESNKNGTLRSRASRNVSYNIIDESHLNTALTNDTFK